jgi:hypothetical protein
MELKVLYRYEIHHIYPGIRGEGREEAGGTYFKGLLFADFSKKLGKNLEINYVIHYL